MRIRSFLFVIACLVTTLSTAQTASKTSGCAPLEVHFTPPAGATKYFWDLGDGTTSPKDAPDNVYTKPGTYNVKFYAGSGGAQVGNTVIINVYAKPVPDIVTTSPLKGCIPLTINVTGTASLPPTVNLVSYRWSFGDGSASVIGSPVTKVYNTPGKFTVALELNTDNPSCDVTRQFVDYVYCSAPPATSFTTTPSPAISCTPPLTVSFTNKTSSSLPVTYLWTLPPNNTTSTAITPAPITLTALGNYTVTLTATDSNKCSSSYNVPISIGSPTASFTVPDTVCLNTKVKFVNTSSSGSCVWNFGADALPASSTLTNPPDVTYSTPGLKTITLEVSAGNCKGNVTKTIFVDDPKVTITAKPSYSCTEPVEVSFTSTGTSPIASWNWSFGDKKGSTSTLKDPKFTYVIYDSTYTKRGMNVFKVTLNVITKAGCVAKTTFNDTVYQTWARFVPDKYQGCLPLEVTFNDSSRSFLPREPLIDWLWDYGDGTTELVHNKGPQKHTFTKAGTYYVQLTVTNKNGCKDTSYKVKIVVGDTKTLDFTVDKTSICPGDTVHFTNTTADKTGFEGWHYSSSAELLSHCFTNDNPYLIFNNKTGPQDITLTGYYNGCASTITKPALINVKGPIARFDFHRSCDKKFEAEFINKSGDATDLTWTFGDGTKLDTVGTITNFTHHYAATGDYTVYLTAKNSSSQCPDSKDTAVIHIKDIQANFTSPQLLCKGAPYEFNAAASVDVYPHCYRGYTWAFSDTDKRPISTADPKTPIDFLTPGNKTVSLIVEDINGCKDTASLKIKVYEIHPKFVMDDTTICFPATVAFDPTTSKADTTIVAWDWIFGDGSKATLPGPGPGNTTHNYTSAGVNPVKPMLIITDNLGCKDTVTKTINIYSPSSKIAITPALKQICLGTEITVHADDYITHGSHLQYEWNMGDGSPLLNTNDFKYTYTKSGTYYIKLKFTEIGSACQGSIIDSVKVQDYPKAHFTSNPSNTTVLCYPQVIDFQDASISNTPITSYLWVLNNAGLTANTPKASYSYPRGTYVIKLTVKTSYGCASTDSAVYNVVGPVAQMNFTPTTICRGDEVTFTINKIQDVGSYTWNLGDGTIIKDTSPLKHVYRVVPPSGKIPVKLIVSDTKGQCPTPVEGEIDMKDVRADFTIANIAGAPDTTICFGEPVIVTNASTPLTGAIYNWTMGDNSTSTSSTTVNHTYPAPGNYTVTLITSDATIGCKDTTSKTISVVPLPDIHAVSDSICPGKNQNADIYVLEDSLKYSYLWTPAKGLLDSTKVHPVVVNPKATTTYYVKVTDKITECSSIDSAVAFVTPPLMDIDFDTLVVVGDPVYLPIDNKNGTIKFTWTPKEGLSCEQCSGPKVQPLKDLIYTVTMKDECSEAHGKFVIRIKPETFIKVPTTFTPNGDGTNDIIYVKGWGIKDLISFQIYNRWGELVFETSELSEGWNGFYKDVLQNNDIYTYKVKALDFFDKEMEAEGHINLMR